MLTYQIPERSSDRRVRVWLGVSIVVEKCLGAADAVEYSVGMARRYPSLRVTNKSAIAVVPDADLS